MRANVNPNTLAATHTGERLLGEISGGNGKGDSSDEILPDPSHYDSSDHVNLWRQLGVRVHFCSTSPLMERIMHYYKSNSSTKAKLRESSK